MILFHINLFDEIFRRNFRQKPVDRCPAAKGLYKHSDRSACARAKWLLSELKAMWVTQSRESRKDTTCAENSGLASAQRVGKKYGKAGRNVEGRRLSWFYLEYWDGSLKLRGTQHPTIPGRDGIQLFCSTWLRQVEVYLVYPRDTALLIRKMMIRNHIFVGFVPPNHQRNSHEKSTIFRGSAPEFKLFSCPHLRQVCGLQQLAVAVGKTHRQ